MDDDIFRQSSWKVMFICGDHSNFVSCVRFSPDGTKFIAVSSNKKGILYDGKTGDKLGKLPAEDGHKGNSKLES